MDFPTCYTTYILHSYIPRTSMYVKYLYIGWKLVRIPDCSRGNVRQVFLVEAQ